MRAKIPIVFPDEALADRAVACAIKHRLTVRDWSDSQEWNCRILSRDLNRTPLPRQLPTPYYWAPLTNAPGHLYLAEEAMLALKP